MTDAAGGVTEFRYDQYGRQISEIRPDGTTITRTYRADNLLVSSSDPRGIETTYQYDTAKRLLQVNAQGEVTKYTYDATGRMLTATNPESQLSWTYDKAGRILQETADGRTIAIQYNADSEPVGQNIAGETLSYVWDKRGLLSGMTSSDGTHTFNWDAIGQMKGINYPNGRTSRWDYDAAGQLTRQNYTDVAGIDYGYEYDSNGLLTNRTGDGAQWSYRYDAIDRLVSATHGAETYSYQYDALGNRLEAGQQYDAFNKLLEDNTHTYEYDVAGNLIKKINKADSSYNTFRYNNRGRMVSFEAFAAGATTPTTTAEYAHDALGRRVLKRVNGTTTHFQWQGNKINAEYDEYGVLVKRYRFALGSSPLQYKTIGALYDVINDHLSTPRVLTNQLHSLEWVSSVSPFGVVDVEKGQSIEFNIRFPGQYFDEESGLNYNRFRDYSPKIGRYIQADPIGLNGGNNGFSYVLGNPVSLVDEYGLCPAGGVLCATGAFVVGYLAKQTPGALISASSNFGVEYAKSGDIKNAAKKGGYGLAMGYMPGGSGVGFTALKTYGGSIVGTKVVDRKSVMTADAHFNASVASAASVLTYPVTNFVVGAQPTLGQMLVAEGAGQSLEYLAGGVRDGWQNLPRDNGFMCLEH